MVDNVDRYKQILLDCGRRYEAATSNEERHDIITQQAELVRRTDGMASWLESVAYLDWAEANNIIDDR